MHVKGYQTVARPVTCLGLGQSK